VAEEEAKAKEKEQEAGEVRVEVLVYQIRMNKPGATCAGRW
jgi:hypothetical protein